MAGHQSLLQDGAERHPGPDRGHHLGQIGPQYIFIIFVGIDLLIRMPLLIAIPETLHTHLGSKAGA